MVLRNSNMVEHARMPLIYQTARNWQHNILRIPRHFTLCGPAAVTPYRSVPPFHLYRRTLCSTCRGDRRSPGARAKPPPPAIMENKASPFVRSSKFSGSRGRPPVAPTAGTVTITVSIRPRDSTTSTRRANPRFAKTDEVLSTLQPYAHPHCPIIARGSTCRGDRRAPGAGGKPPPPAIMSSGEKGPAPACVMPQIHWFARATAGRPYSGHRDHQGAHSPQDSTTSTRRANPRFAPEEERCAISEMRPIRKCGYPGRTSLTD